MTILETRPIYPYTFLCLMITPSWTFDFDKVVTWQVFSAPLFRPLSRPVLPLYTLGQPILFSLRAFSRSSLPKFFAPKSSRFGQGSHAKSFFASCKTAPNLRVLCSQMGPCGKFARAKRDPNLRISNLRVPFFSNGLLPRSVQFYTKSSRAHSSEIVDAKRFFAFKAPKLVQKWVAVSVPFDPGFDRIFTICR